MIVLFYLSNFIFAFSLSSIFVIFFFTPLVLSIFLLLKGQKAVETTEILYPISLIIAVRNEEDLIESKIMNSLSLNYPADKFEIIVFSDGSTDDTDKKAHSFNDRRLHVSSSALHEGKNNALNQAVSLSKGDILVFTDVDSLLEPSVLLTLSKYFGDKGVGGICGKKVIVKDESSLKESQTLYLQFAGLIKQLESRTGSITSNDGTLYAIRKNLFRNIPTAVTDDLYTCLSVIKQGYRFLFEPQARAFIKSPSRHYVHEIQRRRRIVSTSLRGIFILKDLLNPIRYGLLSVNLGVNKVLRRLLPLFLLLLFFSALILSSSHLFFKAFFAAQCAFYLSAIFYGIFLQHMNRGFIIKLLSIVFYFCIGNYGTLLGVIDFLIGKKITKWEPIKT